MRARYSALAVAAATALLPAALVAQTAKGTTAQADPATRFFATAPWATSGPSHIIDQSAPLGGGPANDACGSVTPEALAIGGSLTFTGSTTGATNTGDYAPGSVFLTVSGLDHPTVWHAFTLSQTADVTVSYCNTNPGFSNVWAFLAPSCPADDDAIIASVVNWELCAEENITMVFPSLAAGTYYLPVMYNATDANGPYSIEVSAATFNPYCATWVNMLNAVEPICHVQFAGIDNTSCSAVNCGPALEDFTNTPPAEVVAGQTYALSVSGNTDGNYNNYISVFFDWDQDEVFDTGYGVGAIANTNCGQTATAQIPIPANVPAGTYRMRVVKIYAQVSDPPNYPADPCSEYSYGQAEDYLVNVSESGGGPANDDCANATVIGDGTLAFSSLGATGTDITSCTSNDSNDIWFEYIATCDGIATATTCDDADFDTALSVWSACGGDQIACNDDDNACDGPTSTVTFPVSSGTSYWIRVAGYNGGTGTGNLTVSCDGSVSAPENDDCANATVIGDGTHAFSSENASGTDITSCTSNDSQDIWFEYVATCSGQVTATTCGDADFDTSVSVWTACGGSEIACNDDFDGCGTTSTVTFMATSGTSYWIRVAGYNGQTGTGNLTVSCDGSITSPENDNCGDVTPVALATGSSVTFTGTTVGASNVGDFEPGSELEGEAPTVWHAFTLSECANVTVSYCDTDPAFGNVWIFLSPSCPAGDDYILATNYNFTACPGNATITYNGLEAGTYYLPVMYDAADANGPYSIDVTAVACPPVEPYCTNVINFTQNVEPICSVQFAGIDNTSCGTLNCGPALEDFTSLPPAQVVAGQSYSLSVTGNTDGDYNNYISVFFDWDQDGTFETSQEVGSIVNSACSPAISTTIDVPETAAEGTTRMRIIKDWASSAVYPSDPCGTYDYGQAEDYLVNVTIPTGVNAATGAAWNVFPNPNNGDFTITSGNESGKVLVEVLDLTGRQVHAEQRYMVRGEQTTFNMANRLAAGTYVLRLTSEAGRHEQRIVVR